MKRILVLGASSCIGSALAVAFARGCNLILTGRNSTKLLESEAACRAAGATEIQVVELDLRKPLDPLWSVVAAAPVDLVIDAASASSAIRDSEIEPCGLSDLFTADIFSRCQLLKHLAGNQPALPAVIFISSVLALVRSPDRKVYSLLKQVQEAQLHLWQRQQKGFRLLVVHVGTLIDRRGPPAQASHLTAAVVKAFQEGREHILYGWKGKLVVALYHLQPAIFIWLMWLQRKLRGVGRRGGTTLYAGESASK